MNTLHVFLALVWAVAILGTVAVGWLFTLAYARWAEDADLLTRTALTGIALRVLAICAVLAVVIGVPLDLIGF